jgi:dTDP-4-amino-4,6-dideoxygalactose transaminase
MSPRSLAAPKSPVAAPSVARVIGVARPLLPTAEHITPYLKRIDAARWYSNFGPLVTEFEERLGARHGGASVSTVANATLGLSLLLKVLAPRPGLCLMPGFTFVATAHAAMQAGFTPYFLDVDEASWMLSAAIVRDAIERLKGGVSAVIVVAAFGAMPDVEGFARLEAETGVPIILDAAAAFDGLNQVSLASAVSLHATKALGIGEGGYVVAPHAETVRRFHVTSSFGFAGTRRSMWPASNAKLSEYAAAVGLAALDGWPAARMRWMLAARKLRLACGRGPVAFQNGWGEGWIGSTCVVRTPDGSAAALRHRLTAAGVETRAWWGEGLHREPAFKDCLRDPLPTVELLAVSTLGLPFAVDLGDEEIRAIGEGIGGA